MYFLIFYSETVEQYYVKIKAKLEKKMNNSSYKIIRL